jgi:hypothetical protein
LARTVIDENLLRDAFAYRTTEDDEEEGENESKRNNDKGRVRIEEKGSACSISRMSSIGEDAGTGTGIGIGMGAGLASRGGNGSGIVQKLRSQTASSSNSRCSSPSLRRSCSKDTGTEGSKVHDTTLSESTVERRGQYAISSIRRCSTGNSGGHSNSKIDVEGIVSDFESGSTVRRLQRELIASKHSLDRSAKTVETISNCYHGDDLGSRK